MRLVAIVPAYNAAEELGVCLPALVRAGVAPSDIVVVDDASDDGGATAAVAQAHTVDVIRHASCRGPAAARNTGAAATHADILLFVDADVVVAPDARARVLQHMAERPELDGVFGAYDADPAAPGLVSRYRNLLHHYVHQQGAGEASTFWSGLGAVRRQAFLAVGGYDPAHRYLEDVDLGMRLCTKGFRLWLDPALQGKHLKHWSLGNMISTDLHGRARPWARLLARNETPSRALNLGLANRLSVMATGIAGLSLASMWLAPAIGAITLALALATVLALNASLFRFLAHNSGVGFAIGAFPVHLLHLVCGGIGFAWGTLEARREMRAQAKAVART